MRAKDIDTFTLSRLVGEECAKRYKNHDINVQQELFKIVDEYNLDVNLEILDIVCHALGVSVKFGDGGDFEGQG